MPTPEQRARQNIDELLQQCGWIVQDRAEINLGAGRGVAVREFPLQTGFADYLLFIDRRPIDAIEADAEGWRARHSLLFLTDHFAQTYIP
jgi:type I restriction enzyme R subunit